MQLQRDLGLGSHRTVHFLTHRIRLAMKQDPLASKLRGVVEVDETYIGGNPRKFDGKVHKRGRGTSKIPVIVLVERDGKSVSYPVKRVNARTLKTAIRETVDKRSTIMTDEWKAYTVIGNSFEGGHEVVNHGVGQYVNGDINTNTAESYFALLKRGVHGIYHHIIKKHLPQYCDEFSFRWNHRKTSDGERAKAAIKGMVGKRLAYRVGKA